MATILIVDDDKTIRNNLRQLLEGKYQILESSGVAETLEIVGRNPVDLCLLDVNLADGNGFDLCRTIRNQLFMPIIFVTVNDDEDSLTKGLLCGGDDYVTKPFSFVDHGPAQTSTVPEPADQKPSGSGSLCAEHG